MISSLVTPSPSLPLLLFPEGSKHSICTPNEPEQQHHLLRPTDRLETCRGIWERQTKIRAGCLLAQPQNSHPRGGGRWRFALPRDQRQSTRVQDDSRRTAYHLEQEIKTKTKVVKKRAVFKARAAGRFSVTRGRNASRAKARGAEEGVERGGLLVLSLENKSRVHVQTSLPAAAWFAQ